MTAYLRASADLPGVTCEKCGKAFERRGIEPVCWGGRCQTGFDELPDEAHRLLNIRALMNLLGETGMAGQICKEFEITAEDMGYLALMEMECREIAKRKKDAHGSH